MVNNVVDIILVGTQVSTVEQGFFIISHWCTFSNWYD